MLLSELSARALAERLRAKLGIAEVVVHHIKSAAVAGPDGSAALRGPFCASPKKSTGAGDRFNAGYALGRLLELPPADRLLCDCAASGFFVREARSCLPPRTRRFPPPPRLAARLTLPRAPAQVERLVPNTLDGGPAPPQRKRTGAA